MSSDDSNGSPSLYHKKGSNRGLKRAGKWTFADLLMNSCQLAKDVPIVHFLHVRLKSLWTYVQRVYGRTCIGGMDVRPEGVWTYVHRIFERR